MEATRWNKIEELFNATLSLPAGERPAFLGEKCGDDQELLNELNSLIKEVNEGDQFLSQPAVTLATHVLAHAPGEQLRSGEIFAAYTIVKPLASGGMGNVFLAEDPRLERLVALKLLPPSLVSNHESALRFKQEALAASAISHPNVAHVYEFGQVEDRYYLAMEYVEGKTVRELIKEGVTDLARALDIALQVAQTLEAAHKAGVVHRDIKPENVIIRRDGYVKVLDFGLAKFTGERDQHTEYHRKVSSSLDTTPGLIMGTTGYMSPEQVRGQVVDARTDLWSLGVMLYEMVAGCQPFAGDTPSDTSAAVLLREPKPLTIAGANEQEASRLQDIIARTLEKDLSRRYESASGLVNDLKDLIGQGAASASFHGPHPSQSFRSAPTPFQGTTRKLDFSGLTQRHWRERPRTTKIALVAAAITLVLLLSIVSIAPLRNRLFGSRAAPENPVVAINPKIDSLVILPFDNETGDDKLDFLALGLADDLIRNLGPSRSVPVISLNSARKAKTQQLSYESIGRALQVETLLEGKVKRANHALQIETRLVDLKSSQVIWQEELNAPEGELLKLRNAVTLLLSNKLQDSIAGQKQIVFAEYPTANNEAYRLYLKAKFDRNRTTVAEFKELIKTLEQAVALDQHYTLAYVALAENYNLIGTFLGQSPEYYQPKAKATLEKALAMDDSLAEAHTLLAKIKMDYEHDWLGAEREFKRAIELNPNYELAHHWYGEVYLSAMKRLDESISELEIARRLNPLSSGIMTALSWSYIAKGEYEKAIDACNQAQNLNSEDSSIFDYRAKAFFKLGRFPEAIQDAQRGFEADPNARYLATLGVFYALSGKQNEAREILTRLQTDKGLGEVSKYDLAIVHGALGERDEAFRLFNEEVNSNSVDLLSIRIDPLIDNLRDDSRFAQLEQRFQFP